MSAVDVQEMANAAVADGCSAELVKRIARIATAGKNPQNAERDLLRLSREVVPFLERTRLHRIRVAYLRKRRLGTPRAKFLAQQGP